MMQLQYQHLAFGSLNIASNAGCIFHYDKDFPEGSGKGFKEGDKPNFTGSYYSYTKVCLPTDAGHACTMHAVMQELAETRGSGRDSQWVAEEASLALRNPAAAEGCMQHQDATKKPHPDSCVAVQNLVIASSQALVESLLSEYPNILVLRVRMPIVGDLTYPRNFIAKIIKYEKVWELASITSHAAATLFTCTKPYRHCLHAP